ncbi:uncharacterized protein LOC118510428 isoform X1 [Anopheles stephensi]|uniref:uncharacterized protein LOC118510428 isoform X1 n=1 Tax=Anopheles stephensi TaxID=30069 RepID=UPI001658ABE0|nr:uncharacterized protein LOC118510428 isoform X1 [Anopheles stephensi]
MFKVLCLFAVVVVVAAMPHAPAWPAAPGPAPMGKIVKREVKEPQSIDLEQPKEGAGNAAVSADDDMDKAETFGFGYHHYYSYPRYYYPSYYYGYYPRYHYGYYW